MLQPFQCLLYCPSASARKPSVLLAASGPLLYSFGIQDGLLLSIWPTHDLEGTPVALDESLACAGRPEFTDAERSAKRRRVSLSREVSSSTSAEIVLETPNATKPSKELQVSNSEINKLIRTSSGEYVVAVTGEDKTIRVFELQRDGSLMQISERHALKFRLRFKLLANLQHRPMSKRPCAIALTPDDKTILCGDKFGDVYSLPLLGKPFVEDTATLEAKPEDSNGKAEEDVLVLPAANSRTVHTKKNQEALQNQQKQIRQKKEKKILNFEHQLLLGHVSLLTDLACVSICERTSPFGHRRNYIITSDRDEHIRVSRGMPHAHIVEGYCQGHTEFISKICIPQAHHQLLVSGGGDNYLLVWDWLRGNLHHRIDIGEQINYLEAEYRKSIARTIDHSVSEQPAVDGRVQSLAVSGIWSSSDGRIIVACEG